MTRRSLARARAAGFTMVELLLAVFLSAIVLVAIYYVFIANSQQYYRQEQVVQMQEGMRFALEYLKTDLRNAGRMAVTNSTDPLRRDPGLCAAVQGINGVVLADDTAGGQVPAILANAPNAVRPDEVTMLLDVSGSVPLATRRVAGATVLVLPEDRQLTGEARSMLASQARFENTWRAGQFVRIHALASDAKDFAVVTDAQYNGGAPTVTLGRNTCLPTGVCDAGGCLINPVEQVRYRLRADPADATNTKTDLHREVVDARNANNVLEDLIVAEYAVDLQVWGTYDVRGDLPGAQPDVTLDEAPQDDVGNFPGFAAEGAAMAARPERLRALNVLLATRTPREDPELLVALNLNNPNARRAADRVWFELDPNIDGFARVATMVSEVATPNLVRGN
ncbi:MAG: prepilin-type N-terminal cleavage/methylation domain-containing protein [Myxococcales bacterium]|nr:prepilin-type N-terminal cleavage/methylation domain-containing protein [Myxococcales bacterium]